MHLQPVFSEYDFISMREDNSSVAEELFLEGLCLPSDIKNTEEDMQSIIALVRSLFVKE